MMKAKYIYKLITIMSLYLFIILNYGCSMIFDIESGNRFNASLIENNLKPCFSSESDVIRLLGVPGGKGQALMPFHDSQRTVLTYYFEQGRLSFPDYQGKDRRNYLFVFLKNNIYEGYLLFDSTLDIYPINKQ